MTSPPGPGDTLVPPAPYATPWERRQHDTDGGRHAASAQAFLRLGLILEHDDDSPVPLSLTHDTAGDASILWGAWLPSAGDEEGAAKVAAWAARHHVPVRHDDGHWEAVMPLGGGFRYGVRYTSARILWPDGDIPGSRTAGHAA